MRPTFNYEEKLWNEGVEYVVGIDEVGRGSWAGPVVAAAVVYKREILSTFNDVGLGKVNDSKKLSKKQRNELSKIIKKKCVSFCISEIQVDRINKHGVGKCSQYAFRKSIKGLKIIPQHVLIDAFYIKYLPKGKQTAIIKGDCKCFSIASASIIAKTYRDSLMRKIHKKYPEYRFDLHKGYGTKLHQGRIKKYGLSEIHRKNFNLKVLLKKESEFL